MPTVVEVEATFSSESLWESSPYAERPTKRHDRFFYNRIALTVHESEGQRFDTGFRTPRHTSLRRAAETVYIVHTHSPMRFQLLPQGCLLLLACVTIWTVGASDSGTSSYERAANFFGRHDSASGHTNNWAVLVCASRYWFNYRVRILYRYIARLLIICVVAYGECPWNVTHLA